VASGQRSSVSERKHGKLARRKQRRYTPLTTRQLRLLSSAVRLPQFDPIAIRIDDPRKGPVVVVLAVRINLSTFSESSDFKKISPMAVMRFVLGQSSSSIYSMGILQAS
jgi:hypothetical protein